MALITGQQSDFSKEFISTLTIAEVIAQTVKAHRDFGNYCLLIWKKNCGLDALIVSNLCVIMYNRDICLRAIRTYFLNLTGKAV